ncbi:MAG: glycosyltransferase [Anaerolineae bacterium]|nr:glycosyltransferase [Anaerolineae bacterium]
MNIGILLPGFSSDENDWAIPVQLNLVREMAQHEDVRVLTMRYPHRRDCYPVHGATVYSLGVGQVRGVRRLKLWLDALLTLRRLHREKPFDVFHAMWADETGLIAVWAGKWLGIPSVVSIAGGELARLDDIGYGLQQGVFSRWIVGQALKADCVVAACSYAHRLIDKAGYRVQEDRIRTITLGVDTGVFSTLAPSPSPSSRKREASHGRGEQDAAVHKRLIHVASLVGVKDQGTLLRAMARLPDDVTLDILGAGPEEQHLRKLAGELGIAKRVNFVGSVHHLDLPQYYRQATINVLTSRHEGLGMVTLEAAACGIPTISTAVGLLPDVPMMGITVPIGDDDALAQAICDLLENFEKRECLAHSAYQTVREQYTIQHTVEQFRSLYTEFQSAN